MKSCFLFLLTICFLSACATVPTVEPDPSVLRVGISPDSPPLIFKQGEQISGVEADFARKLAPALNRELTFLEIPREKQLEYLEENKIDIVMSGITITQAREFRVNFTKPYMVAGLTALFRRTDYAPPGIMPSIIRHQNSKIGAVKNTTGAFYAERSYPNAKIILYSDLKSAVSALNSKHVNMVIHDAPLIWWSASRNETDLVAFQELLNHEQLAWAVSKNNRELLNDVNQILIEWKESGSGLDILQNWFPGLGN
ncbi:MAG: transporter substrate-binding domain-containing protein [Kiritimatiellia bacterium]